MCYNENIRLWTIHIYKTIRLIGVINTKDSLIVLNINELKPHPRNEEIYGYNEDVSDLVEKIRKSGVVTTLTITDDNVIIAGNRRWKSCKQLVSEGDTRFCQVKCEVKDFETEWDALEYLVINNDTRIKTMEQKAREAQMLLEVEKVKAEKRKLATLKQNISTDRAELPSRTNDEIGRPRDIVAKKLHMKSGREVERAVKTIKAIDKLKSEGRTADAELITNILNNKATSTAEDLSAHIDDFTEDEKQAIRDKKISAYKAITNHVTQRIPKIKDNMTEEQREALAHKQACKEAVEEYIAQSMGLVDAQEIIEDTRAVDSITLFEVAVKTFSTAVMNLMDQISNLSEEQLIKTFDIIKNTKFKLNSLDLSVTEQLSTDNNDINDVKTKEIKYTMLDRAKRMKDDSEEPLTFVMITGMFKSETNNYLEALSDYIEMVDKVPDNETGNYMLLNQLTVTEGNIYRKIMSLKEAVINSKC